MLCELAGELLSAYLDDELPSHEALSLEKHLKVCPTCAAQLAELRAMRAMLASLEDMAPPPGFHAALHSRLVAAAPAGVGKVASLAAARQRHLLPSRWVAAAAAAAVITISAGSYYLQLSAHKGPADIAMVDPGAKGPSAPGTGGNQPAPTTGGTSVSNPPGNSGSTTNPGSEKPVTGGTVTSPQPPAATGGVTPPQPTKDDGVGLASRPTTAGAGLPGVSGTPTPGVIQGPLLVYTVTIEMQTSYDFAVPRLVSINGQEGGTIDFVGDRLLSGSTKTAKLIELRVPVAKFEDAKAKVLAIAPTISVSDYGTLDITAQANDLQQKLNGLLGREAAIEAVLSGQNVDPALKQQLNAQLVPLKQDIDSCQQQLETYYNQAQLATIQIMVVE